MTEAEHTPGPWEVGVLDHNGQRIVRAKHIEIATCWHHCVSSIEREMEANAHLISAAPDMLDVLRAAHAFLLDQYRDERASALEGHPIAREARPVWQRVCDAIAKAEGST